MTNPSEVYTEAMKELAQIVARWPEWDRAQRRIERLLGQRTAKAQLPTDVTWLGRAARQYRTR